MSLVYNINRFQNAVSHSFPFGELRRGSYYDALNRPVTITQPDSTIITNVYDKGALLQAVASTGSATVSIQNITYNPRGQREDIYYGNNTKTKYYYNTLNFRITRILTTRNSAANNAVKSKYMA